jgi:hypothetical protein
MFLILLSPAIALIADNFLRKYQTGIRLIILLIVLLIAPSVLLLVTGYGFSKELYSFIATTLFLSGVLLGLFTMIHVRFSVKAIASIVVIIMLGVFVFVSLFASGWARNAVLQEAKAENYTAFILKPLYSNHRILSVKKTAFSGLIQKDVYEQDLADSVTIPDCSINFSDGRKRLVYNRCENKLNFHE